MQNRIYIVTHGEEVVFVNASSRTAAINYVARSTISAKVAGQRDLLGLSIEDIEDASGGLFNG